MLKTKEEIQAKIEKCKESYEKIKRTTGHVKNVSYGIEGCEIEAMREFSWDGELDIWEHCSKMTCSICSTFPDIRLFSPEIEVEEHKVESYAYKNI